MLESIRAHRTEPLSGLLDALVRDVKISPAPRFSKTTSVFWP
jgi:hypothetical protein